MTKRERNEIYKQAYNDIEKLTYRHICRVLKVICEDYQTELPEFVIAMPSNWEFSQSLFGIWCNEWFNEQ